MNAFKHLILATPLTAALILAACGDDDDGAGGAEAGASQQGGRGGANGAGGTPSHGGEQQGGQDHGAGSLECEVLGSLCHEEDSGAGPISDCHDTGHVGNVDACTEQFASCISVCVGGETGEGGAGGTATPVSNPYCQALGELCHFLNDEGTPTAECHEVGHVGKEADCIPAFAECVPMCLEKREAGAGAGGAGPHAEGGGAHSEGGGAHSEGGGAHSEGGAGG